MAEPNPADTPETPPVTAESPKSDETPRPDAENKKATWAQHYLRMLGTVWKYKDTALVAVTIGIGLLWYFNPYGWWDAFYETVQPLRPWLTGTATGKAVLALFLIWSGLIIIKNLFALRTPTRSPEQNERFNDIQVKHRREIQPIKFPVDRKDIFPQSSVQIPAISVHYMLQLHSDLIDKLYFAIPLSNQELDQHLLPVIYNLAYFVHQAQASADDHHSGPGGLFTHSLETALYAANEANNTVFERFGMARQIYQARGRWVLAAAYAGLCHDIGKVICDMEVTAYNPKNKRTYVWEPKHCTLYHWLKSNHLDSYTIDYKNRKSGADYDAHKGFSRSNLYRVIPQQSQDFLAEHGLSAIPKALELAIEYTKDDKGGILGKILQEADALSAAESRLQSRGADALSPRVLAIFSALKRLISNGMNASADGTAIEKWKVNCTGAQVFYTKSGCFIVWTPEIATQIRRMALAMSFTIVPEDPERISGILKDNGYLRLNPDKSNELGQEFWLVTPITQEKGYIRCICIDRADRILQHPMPVAIEAIVKGQSIDSTTEAAWLAAWKTKPKQLLEAEEEARIATAPEIRGLAEEIVALDEDGKSTVALDPVEQQEIIRTENNEVIFVNASSADPDYDEVVPTPVLNVVPGPANDASSEPTPSAEKNPGAPSEEPPAYMDDITAPVSTMPASPSAPQEQAFLKQFNQSLAKTEAARQESEVRTEAPAEKKPAYTKSAQAAAAARLIGKKKSSEPYASTPASDSSSDPVPTETPAAPSPAPASSASTPAAPKTTDESASPVSEPKPREMPANVEPIMVKEPDFKRPSSASVKKAPASGTPSEMAPTTESAEDTKAKRLIFLQDLYSQLALDLKAGKGELIQGDVTEENHALRADCTPFLEKAGLTVATAAKFFFIWQSKPWGLPFTFKPQKDVPMIYLALPETPSDAEEEPEGLDF